MYIAGDLLWSNKNECVEQICGLVDNQILLRPLQLTANIHKNYFISSSKKNA